MANIHRGRSSVPSFLSGEQRINKLLAAAGFGSRRQVDELLTEGRVEVDGTIITQVGTKVDADKSKILVDGEPLKRHKPVYFAVHKPAGFLCTNADPEGRPRVIELVPSHARLFPVGRLDSSSTGLILLTNDGELSQRLAHPKHGVPKSYFVVVAGQVDREALNRLQRGIYLAEGIARVDGATIRRVRKGCTEIDITLSEGKNREIRRVLARLGHKVVVLRRVSIASLKLGDLPEGSYRPLTEKEVAGLYKAVDELRSARNQDRRDRKRRSDERRGEIRSTGTNAVQSHSSDQPHSLDHSKSNYHQSTKNKVAQQFLPFDEESDDDESMHPSMDDDFDSLPSLSDNPYRLADDEDGEDGDMGIDDAILVKDAGWDDDFDYEAPRTKGAVLGADDPEPTTPRTPQRGQSRSRTDSRQSRGDGNRRPSTGYSNRSNSSGRPARGPRSSGDNRSRPEGRSRFSSRSSGEGRPVGEGRTQSERRPRPMGTRGRSDDSSAGENRGEPQRRSRGPYRSNSDSRATSRTDNRSRGFANPELGGEARADRAGGNYRAGGARAGRSLGAGSSSSGRRSAPRSSDRSRGPGSGSRGPGSGSRGLGSGSRGPSAGGRGPRQAKRGPRPKR